MLDTHLGQRNHSLNVGRAKRNREKVAAPPPAPRDHGGTLQFAACTVFFSLIVLVFSTRLEVQFSLPKLLVLHVFAATLGAIWLFRHTRGETRPLPPAVIGSAAMLAGWWIVTTVTAVHPATAVWGAHGRYNGLATQLTLLFLCLLVASSRLDSAGIARQMRALVLVLVPAAVYALIQFAGGDPITWGIVVPRSASTIGNPVVFAAVLGLAMPFALVFALRATGLWGRWSWGVVLATLLAASITTLSRGPLLASVVAMLGIVAVVAWDRRRQWSRWVLVGLTIAAALAVVGGYILIIQARGRAGGGDTLASNQDRLHTYSVAAQTVRDHPITGVGLENFAIVYPRYRSAESDQLTPDVVPTMVHNGYLQAAATTGVPGLLAYLAFVALAFGMVVRLWVRSPDGPVRWQAIAFAAAIATYGIQDLTGWLELSLSTFFWLVMGFAFALAAPDRGRLPTAGWPHRLVTAAVAAGVFVVAGLAIQTAVLIRTDGRFRALSAIGAEAGAAVETAAEAALSGGGVDAAYLDTAGRRYAERFAATGATESYRKATGLFEQARALNPFDPYPLVHRLALEAVALQRKAVAASTVESAVVELMALDPNNGSAHEALARVRLAEGRTDDAAAAVRRALELRPAAGRFHELHGDIERAAGRREAAVDAYRAARESLGRDTASWITVSHKLILMLLEDGQPAEALAAARAVLEQQPRDVLGFTLLGHAYLGLKDESRARAAFEEALRIKPGDRNAAEGLQGLNASVKQ